MRWNKNNSLGGQEDKWKGEVEKTELTKPLKEHDV